MHFPKAITAAVCGVVILAAGAVVFGIAPHGSRAANQPSELRVSADSRDTVTPVEKEPAAAAAPAPEPAADAQPEDLTTPAPAPAASEEQALEAASNPGQPEAAAEMPAPPPATPPTVASAASVPAPVTAPLASVPAAAAVAPAPVVPQPAPLPLPPAPQPAAPVVPAAVAPSSAITLSGFEQDMYYSHLATRQQNAVGGLVLDPTLTAVARQRAYDMASNGYFSHYAPGDNSGRATVFRLLAGAGVTYTIAGENIARNNMADSISVSTAMNAFMNSAGHRSTLLDSRYHRVGVGAAVSPTGMKYYAVVFAS